MTKESDCFTARQEWVRIAKIGAPHGVFGEVKVYSLSDVPGRFENLKIVFWLGAKKAIQRLTVVSCKPCERFIIMRFNQISTREQAAVLTNGYLALPHEKRGILPENEYFIDDIIGMSVEDVNGHKIGKVVEIFQTGSNDVYEIQNEFKKSIMIPARKEIVKEVNLISKKLIINMQEGYFE